MERDERGSDLRPCRVPRTHNNMHTTWELLCAGFRHSAGLHARVVLDGGTSRLRELGDVRDVLSVSRCAVR